MQQLSDLEINVINCSSWFFKLLLNWNIDSKKFGNALLEIYTKTSHTVHQICL